MKLIHLPPAGELSPRGASSAPSEPPLCLSAAILYNEPALAHKAGAVCRHIEQLLPNVHVYATRTINLNGLISAMDAVKAGSETANADLVFICAGSGRELSPWTKLWMRDWASHRTRSEGALICFSDGDCGWRECLQLEFLENLAQVGNLSFIQATGNDPRGEIEPLSRFVSGLN